MLELSPAMVSGVDGRPKATRLALGLATAVLAISSAAVVIRALGDVDPAFVAGGRVAVTAAVLAVLGPGAVLAGLHACLRDRALGARVSGASLLLALHFGTRIASLRWTTVGAQGQQGS